MILQDYALKPLLFWKLPKPATEVQVRRTCWGHVDTLFGEREKKEITWMEAITAAAAVSILEDCSL